MGKLIELSERIARARAFLSADIYHDKECLVLEVFSKLNILTGIYINLCNLYLPAEILLI